jgi:toxin YoeB
MITAWTEAAWQDYLDRQKEDEKVLQAINALIKDIKRDPFKGLGKPEPLKHALKGWWSRRITGEHRLVYRVTGKADTQQLDIAQCRYHY